ncbi:hypothetical protein BY458DRAFT_480647 [Sporodiniella umbellata]|nr:hypothetical protein BY458DRAFT_480647 [Sporodiniella umbellata]
MKWIAFYLLVSSFGYFVQAGLAPTYPEPGTVWRAGQEYKIIWKDDKVGTDWKKFKIDFMTGDNHNQKVLKSVAVDVEGDKVSTMAWVAPQVDPPSAIYFFMFTNEKGEHSWTTRFGITGSDGKLVPAEHELQSDGAKIPWGVGKVVVSNQTTTTTRAVFSMTPAQSSVAAENAKLVIAVSLGNRTGYEIYWMMASVLLCIVVLI